MRKRLIAAFLLVLVAVVLGSTVFREQVVSAATTPFQNVVVQNTSTNPVPVTQVGTSTTSVSGTVGIDPSKNTVNLGSNGNTHLDSTDANLANIDNAARQPQLRQQRQPRDDGQAASPGAVTEQCSTTAAFERLERDERQRAPHAVHRRLLRHRHHRLRRWTTTLEVDLLLTTATLVLEPRRVGHQRRSTRTSSISPIRSTSTRSTVVLQQRQHDLQLQPRGARQLDRQLTS